MNGTSDGQSGIIDTLLREISKRVQLSPTNYRLAVDRYQAVSAHLDREGSPLQGLVERLYPQGSMAIGSVISSKFENDEFDIDVVAELNIHQDEAPSLVLDTLFKALNGDQGSRYHGKVERCSRCVKVQYENMHLDVTPAVLLPGRLARTSKIFHANENESISKHYTVTANPWGFAQWFQEKMPDAALLLEELRKYVVEPAPEQEPHFVKPKPLVALQLLKRWRNKMYDKREGRMPPSVMLSCLIAQNLGYRASLFDELQSQSSYLLRLFQHHSQLGSLVSIDNPACPKEDAFTDRWPKTLNDQQVFLGDLIALNQNLQALSENRSLENCKSILANLFGEKQISIVIEKFAEEFGAKSYSGGLRHYSGTGAMALAASGLAPAYSSAKTSYATPQHTFYGSD
jgi:hypothetical protein